MFVSNSQPQGGFPDGTASKRCPPARGRAAQARRAQLRVLLLAAGVLALAQGCEDSSSRTTERDGAEVSAAKVTTLPGRQDRAPLPLALPAVDGDSAFLVNAAGESPPVRPMSLCPKQVPTALSPPPGVTLVQALPAVGVQIYVCSGKSGEPPAWTLEAPHAVLGPGRSVRMTHFGGPTWQALDGSLVRGSKLAAADGPKPGSIPWLLLAAESTGAGTLEGVSHIQRLATEGGQAPRADCDEARLGTKVLVPYRADYFFYRPAAAGETVKQCGGGARPAH